MVSGEKGWNEAPNFLLGTRVNYHNDSELGSGPREDRMDCPGGGKKDEEPCQSDKSLYPERERDL